MSPSCPPKQTESIMKVSKKSFKEWWNSPAHNGSFTPRQVAEAAWNFACEMQEHRLNDVAKQNIEFRERIKELEDYIQNTDSRERIAELEEQLKESQQKHLDSIRALRRANEQITSIAKDNGKLRTDLESYQEPKKERPFKYIATVNEVCEDEADAFYMGTLDDIMEWCEDWNHCINDVRFYRLGDEVRIGFVDMGKETRFGVK